MSADTKEVQVICTRVIWFEDTEINGQKAQTRHSANYGEVVTIPKSEAERIAAFGGVQEAGGVLPRTGIPAATPFSQPRADATFKGPVMGDPTPGAPVGGLTPEQVAQLQAKADGGDDPSMTDEDYIAEKKYNEAGVKALEQEARDRGIYDEIEGSGANDNVIKPDLVAALEEDDE